MNVSELSHVENLLQSFTWDGWPNSLPRREVHDHIQSFLVSTADYFGYTGRAEIRTELEDRSGFIDIGWYDGTEIVAGFEVDGTIRRKSIAKLATLPDPCLKVVVSKSTNKDLISQRKRERLPDWCNHIDAKTYKHFE